MIRQLIEADIADITALYNHYVENGVETFETEKMTEGSMRARAMWISLDNPYYVCRQDGKLAGFAYAHVWKERAAYCNTYEVSIYLDPACRHQGIGTQLMKRVIADCMDSGCHALVACVTGINEASRCFFEKLGFKQVSHFKEVGYKMGMWLDVVDYELVL